MLSRRAGAWLLLAPVLLTVYSSPHERDFGDKAVESVTYRDPETGKPRTSLFAKGFGGRAVECPTHPGIFGAAMEGSGWIDPTLHEDDPGLSRLLKRGYVVLSLQEWDEKTGRALLTLSKVPMAADGKPLIHGLSAAGRPGNKRFPLGGRVQIRCPGAPPEVRLVHDECSSCETDDHLDLYEEREYDGKNLRRLCEVRPLP